jgi:DNA polymerase III sliding clamp (beta) subunit (PCNA family)
MPTKISVNAGEFKHAISVASKISSAAHIGPLNNILIEIHNGIARITSSNYVATAISEISVESNSDDKIKICVLHKLISDITSAVFSSDDERISMSLDDKTLTIIEGRKKFKISTLDPDLFPAVQLPEISRGTGIVMSGKTFSSAVAFGSSGSDDDAVIPYQKIINIRIKDGNLEFSSTDSKKLFISTVKTETELKEFDVVLGSKQAKDIGLIMKKYDSIEFMSSGNFVVFVADNMIIGSLKIDCKFPNIEKIKQIGESLTSSAIANAKSIKDAIKDVEIFGKDRGTMLIDFQKDQIMLSSNAADKGSGDASVEAVVDGEQICGMIMNIKYVQSFFSNPDIRDESKACIKFKDKNGIIWISAITENIEMNAYLMSCSIQ